MRHFLNQDFAALPISRKPSENVPLEEQRKDAGKWGRFIKKMKERSISKIGEGSTTASEQPKEKKKSFFQRKDRSPVLQPDNESVTPLQRLLGTADPKAKSWESESIGAGKEKEKYSPNFVLESPLLKRYRTPPQRHAESSSHGTSIRSLNMTTASEFEFDYMSNVSPLFTQEASILTDSPLPFLSMFPDLPPVSDLDPTTEDVGRKHFAMKAKHISDMEEFAKQKDRVTTFSSFCSGWGRRRRK